MEDSKILKDILMEDEKDNSKLMEKMGRMSSILPDNYDI
jgi:hypothetical protein